MAPLTQYAALPYVEVPGGILVLVITSRGTGRWVIPKGWPKPRRTPAELAALEARQEAGVRGVVDPAPAGSFVYWKRLHLLAWTRCRVEVFPLLVDVQKLDWKEKPERRLNWCTPAEAAALVRERGLKALIRAFADGRRRASEHSIQVRAAP